MTQNQIIAKVVTSAAVISIDKPYDYEVPTEYISSASRGMRVMVPFGRGNSMSEGFILSVGEKAYAPRIKKIAYVFDGSIMLDEEALALAAFIRSRYFCTFFEAADLLVPTGIWSRKGAIYCAVDMIKQSAIDICQTPIEAQIYELIFNSKSGMCEGEIKKLLPMCSINKSLKNLVKLNLITQEYSFDSQIKDSTIKMVKLGLPLDVAIAKLRNSAGHDLRVEILKYVAGFDEIPEKEACYITGASSGIIRAMVKSGLLQSTLQESYRRPQITQTDEPNEIVLEPEQADAMHGIEQAARHAPSVVLLNGVTGSGKTPIYIKLIANVLKASKSAILLVPEIALTPQMLRQFCAYFKDEVAVFHSSLSTAQRYDEYKRVASGKAHVVIGTRSAIFAPLKNIGMIIIDEEQEWTYKSEISPRYHAREIAKFRCVQHKATLVLGSATPAIESYCNAKNNKYHLFKLKNRYQNTPLPSVIIADMRKHLSDGDPAIIGKELSRELEQNLKHGEQSVFFINRRGNSRMLTCVDCGNSPKCVNCSVSLTYHSKNNRLMCHHCGYSCEIPTICPECGGDKLKLIGFGTQKVQEELELKFPGIRVVRMDADTTNQRISHEKLLDEFALNRADVLLGTQMIAKGLDFDNVTLVGVLDADLALYNEDYRAGERTFSLLTQVIGRAGRRAKTGRAVIQTYTPKNPIILAAAAQNYEAFYDYEIEMREALQAPPFMDIISFVISGSNESATKSDAARLACTIESAFKSEFTDLCADVLGPSAPSIAFLNKKYRFQVSFRGHESARTRALIIVVLKAFYSQKQGRDTMIAADINPYSL